MFLIMDKRFTPVDAPSDLTSYASRDDMLLEGFPLWFTGVGAVALVVAIVLFPAIYYNDVPRALYVVPGVALFIGLVNLEYTLHHLFIWLRHRSVITRYPGQSWVHDYPWDDTGHNATSLRHTLVSAFAGLFWFTICNVPVTLIFILKIPFDGPVALQYTLIPFISVMGFFFLYFLTLRRTFRYLRFGATRLQFNHAPFLTGSTLKATLKPACFLGSFKTFTLTLRCIQPTYISNEGGRVEQFVKANADSSSDDGPITRFRQVFIAQYIAHDITLDSNPLQIDFDIPADAPSTFLSLPIADYSDDDQLNSVPPPDGMRYWELVAHGKRSGVDFHVSFLVPVYSPQQAR